MRKLAIALAAFVVVSLPVAADAAPDHQHGGAQHSRIDWD